MGNLANGSFLKRTLGPEDSQKKKNSWSLEGISSVQYYLTVNEYQFLLFLLYVPFTLCLNWRKGKEKKEKKDIFIVWFQRWKGNLKELKGKCFLWAHKNLSVQIEWKSKKA